MTDNESLLKDKDEMVIHGDFDKENDQLFSFNNYCLIFFVTKYFFITDIYKSFINSSVVGGLQ